MRRSFCMGCAVTLGTFFLSFAVVSATFAESKSSGSKTVKDQKDPVVVVLTLDGEYAEEPSEPGPLGNLQPTLPNLLRRLDAAAVDKNVAAVWLKIADLSVGRATIFEIRAAVARLRKAGKPVYAELTTADSSRYLLASACDEICMPPSGMLLIPGVRAEITFYKGLLDKLGLQFDALRMGKYKGAFEPLTNDKMSAPLRESYEALVDDNYQILLSTIAADRHLKDYQVKTYVDRGLFTPEDAKKAKLIDSVLYADEIQEAIQKKLKADKVRLVTDYKKQKIDTDFSGLSGLMKLIALFSGEKQSGASAKKPKIAVVYAVGQIVEGKSTSSMFGASALGSSTLIAALRKAAADPKVAAVVLRINSPGGSATASDLIWRETTRLKKPFVASMGDVAGSGGYYIAAHAERIFAAPGTLTGSIGVLGGKLVTRGLYDKLGMKTEVIARGANSGSMSANQPFSPDERKVWTEVLQETYRQFVSKVAEGRKMQVSRVEELAQGRVYTGQTAKKLGLIDEIGTLNDAVVAAKKAAGLKADADVEMLLLPEPKTFFEQLFGGDAASEAKAFLPEAVQLLQRAATLRRVLSERVLTWMPYEVQVK
jgi:protease IV